MTITMNIAKVLQEKPIESEKLISFFEISVLK
jgi:hypothetical protein